MDWCVSMHIFLLSSAEMLLCCLIFYLHALLLEDSLFVYFSFGSILILAVLHSFSMATSSKKMELKQNGKETSREKRI